MRPTLVHPKAVPAEVLPSWRHQREAFWHCVEHDGSMLDMKMGTGKTKVVIDLACYMSLHRESPKRKLTGHLRVLVICPKAVVPVWPSQFEQHAHKGIDYSLTTGGKGSTKRRAEAIRDFVEGEYPGDMRVVVVNYEAARSTSMGYDKAKRRDGVLLRTQWDLVVLAESHSAKQPSGPTHLLIKRLRAQAAKRICLSGTPFPQGPIDAWSQFVFLDPTVLELSFVQHRARYCKLGGPTKTWIMGAKNVDEFGARIAPLTYSCGEEVVDIPRLRLETNCFDLSPRERKAYDAMEDDFVTWIGSDAYRASNALSQLLRLSQITSGYLPSEDEAVVELGTSRQDALVDFLSDQAPDERVVVFTRFKRDTDTVEAILRRRDPDGHCGVIRGGKNTVGAVWEGRETGCVAQIQSGSLGSDLTAARYGVVYGDTWDAAAYEQLKKRIHRPGQRRPCFIYHLVSRDTVNETALDALQNKRETASLIETVVRAYRTGGHE